MRKNVILVTHTFYVRWTYIKASGNSGNLFKVMVAAENNHLFLLFHPQQRWKRIEKIPQEKSGKRKSLSIEWMPQYSCERDTWKWLVLSGSQVILSIKVSVLVKVLLLLCRFGLWFSTALKNFNFLDNQWFYVWIFSYIHGALKQNDVHMQELCHVKKFQECYWLNNCVNPGGREKV